MPMDILSALKADYDRFPRDQTYSLYAEDVSFKDPMTQFRGRVLYRQMIGLMSLLFRNCIMDLHDIRQEDNRIHTQWTLSWNAPLPWSPRIAVPGRSELTLNADGLIASHIDYWNCSRLDVLKQHFQR